MKLKAAIKSIAAVAAAVVAAKGEAEPDVIRTSAGEYVLPGPSVEAMYFPDLRSKCAPARVKVK